MKYQRIFRIFVSSTFSDMKAERDALQERVFPQLREYCQQHNWQFQAVDLRWGVNDETGHDQQTMRLCLAEIERSQQVSPKLNFLILLGERYGWIPLPGHIEQSEFELLFGKVTEVANQQLLNKWYRLDENAMPPAYVLQPREDEFKTWNAWSVVENQLQGILQQAATACGFDIDSHPQFFASATDQEIRRGALEYGIDPQAVIGVLRTINGLPATAQAAPYLDINADGSIDQQARKQQLQVHSRLKAQLPGQMCDLQAKYNAGTLDANYITAVCEHVRTELQRVIDSEIAQTKAIDAEIIEINFHAQFAEERGAILLGRDDILAAIRQHVAGDTTQPLVLHGLGGAGKSAIMARAINEAEKTVDSNTQIVYRFLGTSPGSSDVRGLVTSLCKQIGQVRGDNTVPPVDINELNAYFHKLLTDTPSEQRLVMLLDALDQLADRDGALDLPWLPKQLPANVRIVVSVLDGTRPHYILSKILPPKFLLELPPLSEPSASAILDAWLQPIGRTLTPDQQQALLHAHTAAGGLALYLKLAFEEARHWRSYTPAPQLPSTQEALVDRLFTSLAEPRHHGSMLVQRALAYLMAATDGLNDAEIVDVLSSDAEYFSVFEKSAHWPLTRQRLPDVIWSRLYFDLQPYLSERYTPGAVTYAFYHRVLQERAIATYLPAGTANTQQRHAHLANYFLNVSTNRDRKYTEIPRQCTLAHWWQELMATLTDLAFLEGKAESGRTLELARDFAFALNKAAIPLPKIDAVPTTDPPAQFAHPCGITVQRRHLELLDEALRRDLGFLTQYPQSLFQQLYNLCYWYDSPEAAAHYEPDDKGLPVIPGAYEKLNLHQLMTFWAADVEQRGKNWLRSQRPPQSHLANGLQMLMYSSKWINSAVYSPEGMRILFTSHDEQTIKECDAYNGILLQTISNIFVKAASYGKDGQRIIAVDDFNRVLILDSVTYTLLKDIKHKDELYYVSYSPNSKYILSTARGGNIWVWDSNTWDLLHTLQSHTKSVPMASYSPNSLYIISASYDKTVKLWNVSNGELVHTFIGHEDWVFSAVYSPNELYIVSASKDKTIKVWDAHTRKLKHTLRGHEGSVLYASCSPNSKYIVSASNDKTVRIWDANSGILLHIFYGHSNDVVSACYSPDGQHIISASRDHTIRVWDANSRTSWCSMKGHKGEVMSLNYSPNGKYIVSASDDKTVRIWNAENGELLPNFCFIHENRVNSAVYSLPDGINIVSASRDGIITIWDANNGKLLHSFGHSMKPVLSVAYNFTGRNIASASLDDTVKLWDDSGNLLHSFNNHLESLKSVNFSPNGSYIVSASNGKVCVLDVKNGELLNAIPVVSDGGFPEYVTSATYSPDGYNIIAYSNFAKYLWMWNAESGQLLKRLPYVHDGRLTGINLLLAAGIQPATGIELPILARPRPYDHFTKVQDFYKPDNAPFAVLPRNYSSYYTNPQFGGRRFVCTSDDIIDFYELRGPLPGPSEANESMAEQPVETAQNSEQLPIKPNANNDNDSKNGDDGNQPEATVATEPEATIAKKFPAPPAIADTVIKVTTATVLSILPQPLQQLPSIQRAKYTALTFIAVLWVVIIGSIILHYFTYRAAPTTAPAVETPVPAAPAPTFTKAAMCQAAAQLLQHQLGLTARTTQPNLNPEQAASGQEINILLTPTTGGNVIAIGCRATWDFWSVADYLRRVARFKQRSPQYATIPINAAIVGMDITPQVIDYAADKGLYVISAGDTELVLQNKGGFIPKTW